MPVVSTPVAAINPPEPKPKPKPNLILPVSPMFASIMAPVAKRMVKKICKVKNMGGHTEEFLNIVKETNWNQGPENDNLEQRSLDVGTIGMVVGVADPCVLRFLVSQDNPNTDGIYHVNVLNLEILTPEEEEKE